MRKFTLSTNKILLVESRFNGLDKLLIQKIIQTLDPTSKPFEDIYTQDFENGKTGSVSEVINYIELLPLSSFFSKINKIGIIVDADNFPEKRHLEILDALFKNKEVFSIPKQRGKFYKDGNKVSVGIFLLPDNKSRGSLERLMWESLRPKYKPEFLKSIDNFVEKLKKDNYRIKKMTINNIYKAKFRVLNAFPDPDNYVKNSLESININSNKIDKLRHFLEDFLKD